MAQGKSRGICVVAIGDVSMNFDALLQQVRAGGMDIAVDSRRVGPGDVFVAVPGASADGAQYIPAAVRAGAAVVVCGACCAESGAAQAAGVTVVTHADPREALWRLAQARYRTDAMRLRVVGITGTNGKTTSAYLLEHLFTRMGRKVGVLGTVSYRWPGHVEAAPLTTPDSLHIHSMLARMEAAGVDIAVLEVSSHALDQQRVGGIAFAGAIFTNLTQDHLDYHPDMDGYFTAKSRLFLELPRADKASAINADDPWGRRLLEKCPSALSFGLHEAPARDAARHIQGRVLSMSTAGLHLAMQWGESRWELRSPLVGAFNASNLMAVQAVALGMGASPADMRHLEDFFGVPGRLERIANAQGLDVFVDYAHTPDALVNVLEALRGAGFQRIVTVFGCGGNRDRTKRPRMGAAVASLSDVAVLTSDNPRNEDPVDIINDVLPGLHSGARQVEIVVEPSRREATRMALAMLRPGDALCIAGKGHEDYQIIQGVKHPYSDQQTVRELLQCA